MEFELNPKNEVPYLNHNYNFASNLFMKLIHSYIQNF